MNTALSIEHVSHWYGDKQVLFDIGLNVPRGSITAVIGPSGQGKTTLLRIIGGFEIPRNGVVRIGERVVNEQGKCLIPSERRGVSIVPQEGALFPHLSVVEMLHSVFRKGAAHRQNSALQKCLKLLVLRECKKCDRTSCLEACNSVLLSHVH